MLRTANDGELRAADASKKVVLTGWAAKIRNLGAIVFLDLRDRYGLTQIRIDPELFKKQEIRNEYCLQVEGTVQIREEKNPSLATGEIEVVAEKIHVFAPAQNTPFIIADKTDALEDTRLKTRYLDLRRPCLQKNLMIRHLALKAARDYLESKGFLEVETPTLVRSTPEGARDYLVPSRTFPGEFYALPQSPQLFKQLLMIAGMDRYYQVARCYRDEDLRADRQPEFTQIDCEMSFIEREDVLSVIEGMLDKVFKDVLNVNLEKFTRISYMDAINIYGSDKPDLRFEMKLSNVTSILQKGTFEAYQGKTIKALVVPSYATKASRKKMDEDNNLAKKFRVHGVSFFKVENGALEGSLAKYFTPEILNELAVFLKAKEGDLIIVGADEEEGKISVALGALRSAYGKELGLTDPNVYKPLFVLDWPLFEREDDGHYESLSNPFTRPRDEDLPLLKTDPTKVLSYAYDTVINGLELSSGSLRIYDGNLQKEVFELLGLSKDDIKNRFGFFVDAFNYGTPPHGGFAIGVERLSMVLCQTDNVRDVVAFPKNLQAADMMCQAPSSVPEENLKILGIQVAEKKD
ncbi:MAG: aspartate--tRNA ligase [Bacilli bacterium]|jgi:aspartyl-tRNA synthetase|nr:aspartate--tRNA ligase [Bacilli bacterium]